jgi:hypothetical protein
MGFKLFLFESILSFSLSVVSLLLCRFGSALLLLVLGVFCVQLTVCEYKYERLNNGYDYHSEPSKVGD